MSDKPDRPETQTEKEPDEVTVVGRRDFLDRPAKTVTVSDRVAAAHWNDDAWRPP